MRGLLLVGWLLVLSKATSATELGVCSADLAQQINAITRSEFRRARWGILVQTVAEDPHTVYADNADQLFIPASNVKLLTTAAALTQLGGSFRIRTSVYQMPSSSANASQTVLRVVGQGDPSFSDAQLQALAQQLAKRGIQQIQTLIADDQAFASDAVNPTWEWEDIQAGYGAASNGLILNQNAINFSLVPQALGQPLRVEWDDPAEATRWQIVNRSETVAASAPEFVEVGRDFSQLILHVAGHLRAGSAPEPVAISVSQPAQNFLAHFQQALAAQQIQVAQTALAANPLPAAAQPIATVESPALTELLIETNQQSNNLYAEAILRQLGISRINPTDQRSYLTAGIAAVQNTLTELGVDPAAYSLADGSGLSRQNLASPQAFVETLQAMAQSPDAASYRASLSTAGISGTLRYRFQNTPVEGNFRGKTGTLSGVTVLSGYLALNTTSELAVSILVNHFEQPLSVVQGEIDAIVQLLMQRGSC